MEPIYRGTATAPILALCPDLSSLSAHCWWLCWFSGRSAGIHFERERRRREDEAARAAENYQPWLPAVPPGTLPPVILPFDPTTTVVTDATELQQSGIGNECGPKD